MILHNEEERVALYVLRKKQIKLRERQETERHKTNGTN
jgi:hypothetical protein